MSTPEVDFKVYLAKSGKPTISARIEGQPEFFLHSSVDPLQEGKDWLARVEMSDYTAYFILGFGLGYHVQALLEKLPLGSHIYVIENKAESSHLCIIKNRFANKTWMVDARISVSTTNDLREISMALARDMNKRGINKVTLCRYYPVMMVFPEFYNRVEKELVAKVGELFCLNFNHRLGMGITRTENAWLNIPYIGNSPGVKALDGRFAGMPVIIVAAGPSLNKNIEELKRCTNRAIVIAAGSTMGAMYTHGITPNFLAVCDAGLPMYEALKGVVDADTILLTPYDVNYKVVSEYPGRKMFTAEQEEIVSRVKHLLPDTVDIQQSISVATMALNFALYCCANPIIFVGQDLSFSADSTHSHHADGVNTNEYTLNDEQVILVPGYNGGEVPTVRTLRDVIQYFETMINIHPQVSFINATEGGARIQGAKQLKLSEVSEQFLQEVISIDSIIDEVYSQLTVSDYNELRKAMLDIRQEIIQMTEVTNLFTAGVLKKIDETLEWNQTECDKLQSEFDIFFDKLPNYAIYNDIKIILEPLQALVKYHLLEGITFQKKIETYFELKNNLLVVLARLDDVVRQGMEHMEEMSWKLQKRNGR